MLKLSHISKTFNPGTVNEKVAIRDLSLHLEKGDFATIIGSNGAGKSTMFNAICGDFLTDSGSVVLDGEDITFLPQHARAKNIGRLYQDPMRGTAPGTENISKKTGFLKMRNQTNNRKKRLDLAAFLIKFPEEFFFLISYITPAGYHKVPFLRNSC